VVHLCLKKKRSKSSSTTSAATCGKVWVIGWHSAQDGGAFYLYKRGVKAEVEKIKQPIQFETREICLQHTPKLKLSFV
jgi:hypothetical protein